MSHDLRDKHHERELEARVEALLEVEDKPPTETVGLLTCKT